MSISIGSENGSICIETEFSGRGVPAKLTEIESKIVNPVITEITEKYPHIAEGLLLDRRASQYLTLSYMENYDFLRIKAGAKSLWFSMWVGKQNRNDKRLEQVDNKRLVHWKIKLSSPTEINAYMDLICAAAEIAMKGFNENKQ